MDNNWKILVLLLKEFSEDKMGVGYQCKLAEITGLKQSNISRMFALKYTPTLESFLIIAKALKINFFFEDQESKTELNVMMERAMENLNRRLDKL